MFWRSRWAHENRNGVARRSPSECFPRNYYVEGTRSRKCEFLCFPDFIKNKPRSRANVFTADMKRILVVTRRWPSTRRGAEDENNSLFCCQDDLILFFFNRLRVTHASFSNRHLVDSSIFYIYFLRLGDIIRGRESQRYRTISLYWFLFINLNTHNNAHLFLFCTIYFHDILCDTLIISILCIIDVIKVLHIIYYINCSSHILKDIEIACIYIFSI